MVQAELDLLTKLGDALDQGEEPNWDDTSTAHELVGRMATNIAQLADDDNYTVRTPSDADDQLPDIDIGADEADAWEAKLLNRATPYEIWKRKNEKKGPTASVKKLKEKEWDRLVSDLHNSDRYKQSIILRSQQQAIADEYRHWTFKPDINKKSKALTSNLQNLQERLRKVQEKKATSVSIEKKRRDEEEMKECSFKPNTASAQASNKILEQSTRHLNTYADQTDYWREVQEKREARRAMLTAIEARELSFTPSLNRKSLQLQKKMKESGRVITDERSHTTTQLPSSIKKAAADTSFHPEITKHAYSRNSDTSGVFDRLYDQAVDQKIRQHNASIETFSTQFNELQLRPWERETMVRGASSSWVRQVGKTWKSAGDKDIMSDLMVNLDDQGDDVCRQFATIEYSKGLDCILENVNELWLAKMKQIASSSIMRV